MRYFLRKQIHSCCASMSSSDVFLVKEVDANAFPDADASLETTVSDTYGFSVAYVEPDKRFYYEDLRSRHNRNLNTEAFNTHVDHICEVERYLREHAWLDEQMHKHWADESHNEEVRRSIDGYIFPSYEKKKAMSIAEHQGGFSDAVFNEPELQNYLSGNTSGYIGHYVRKKELDTVLEREFLAVNPDTALFAMWLTSSGARHFGDSLERDSLAEQEAYIKQNVAGCVSEAKGYAKKAA